jgi:hypothetical protein
MCDHFSMVKTSDTLRLCFHPIVQRENEVTTEFELTVFFQDR